MAQLTNFFHPPNGIQTTLGQSFWQFAHWVSKRECSVFEIPAISLAVLVFWQFRTIDEIVSISMRSNFGKLRLVFLASVFKCGFIESLNCFLITSITSDSICWTLCTQQCATRSHAVCIGNVSVKNRFWFKHNLLDIIQRSFTWSMASGNESARVDHHSMIIPPDEQCSCHY